MSSKGAYYKNDAPSKSKSEYWLEVNVPERAKKLDAKFKLKPEDAPTAPERPPKPDPSSSRRSLPPTPSEEPKYTEVSHRHKSVTEPRTEDDKDDTETSEGSSNTYIKPNEDDVSYEDDDNPIEEQQDPYYSTGLETEYDIGGVLNTQTAKNLIKDIMKKHNELIGSLNVMMTAPTEEKIPPRQSRKSHDEEEENERDKPTDKIRSSTSNKESRSAKYMQDLKTIHEKFSMDLTELDDNWDDSSTVGTLLLRHVDGMGEAYKNYIGKIDKAYGKFKLRKGKDKKEIDDFLIPLKHMSWFERAITKYLLSLELPVNPGEKLKGINEEKKTVAEMLGRLIKLNREIETSYFIKLFYGKDFQQSVRLVGLLYYAHAHTSRKLKPNPLTKENSKCTIDLSFMVTLVNQNKGKETKPIFKFNDGLVIAHPIPDHIDKNSYICVHFRSTRNLTYTINSHSEIAEVTIKAKDAKSGAYNTDIVLEGTRQLLDAVVEDIPSAETNNSSAKVDRQSSAPRGALPPEPPKLRTAPSGRNTIHDLDRFAKSPQVEKNSKTCPICESSFTKIGRRARRFCKGCGKAVCSACSPNKIYLPHSLFTADNVCTDCYQHAKTYLPHLKCPDSKKDEKDRRQTAMDKHGSRFEHN